MSRVEAWLIVVAAVLAIWLLRAIFQPWSKCWWCKGRGTQLAGQTREGNCWRCHGERRRMTWLARKIRRLP